MAADQPGSAKSVALRWREVRFAEFAPQDLYRVLTLRSEVFVVEQQCLFLEMDGKDEQALHLLGEVESDGELAAYVRLFAPGDYYAEAAIGRVVTSPRRRGGGLGRRLMEEAIARVQAHWGPTPIRIGAQAYLQGFYESLGFYEDGPRYIEDGIPHLLMRREP